MFQHLRAVCAALLVAPFCLSVGTASAADVCGSSSISLLGGQTIDVGSVDFSNDEANLGISYSTTGGWSLREVHAHVACSLSDIPQTKTGNPKVGNFDYSASLDAGTTSYSFTIGLDSIECLTACDQDVVIAAHAVVEYTDASGNVVQAETAWGSGTGFPGRNWATYATYTVACCVDDPPPPTCDEQLRTQTQGGWGTSCRGSNPGCYRDANFDSTFPDGLLVGGLYAILFTESAVVEGFLPQGGTPGSLMMDYIDPSTSTEAGVLAGQVTALSLSVAFDDADPSFGASSYRLGDMVAQTGDCAGMTVDQILAAGNAVLGGDTSSFSASQINACVDAVNNNYVDGNTNGGFLCTP